MHRVLVVDDDQELCELLRDYLSQEGFEVAQAHDGDAATLKLKEESFDLLVLDVMMPKKNGFEVLREVRKERAIPILMLTAKGDEIDRIVGLELGADDYMSKPCNPRELVARIRSILRRFEANPSEDVRLDQEDIKLDDLVVQVQRRRVLVENAEIELTATEYQILMLLVNSAGSLITREKLSEECLGRRMMVFDRSIDMHISHIRKKLGLAKNGQERIKTIRGTGYQYVAI